MAQISAPMAFAGASANPHQSHGLAQHQIFCGYFRANAIASIAAFAPP